MARRNKISLEAAVTASPLFRLPLELRTMIYESLLVQHGAIAIPSGLFRRIKHQRDLLGPLHCLNCEAIIFNHLDHRNHRQGWCRNGDNDYSYDRDSSDFPQLNTAILQACRLIHYEATHIIYTKNAFHFSEPKSVTDFRFTSDPIQACLIQEIRITMAETDDREGDNVWLRYISQAHFNLAQDFPYLKRLVIDLDRLSQTPKTLQIIAARIHGLDWLHVTSLNDVDLLELLKPMVVRDYNSQPGSGPTNGAIIPKQSNSCNSEPSIQSHVIVNEYRRGLQLKDATLWWGSPLSTVPYVPSPRNPAYGNEGLFNLDGSVERLPIDLPQFYWRNMRHRGPC